MENFYLLEDGRINGHWGMGLFQHSLFSSSLLCLGNSFAFYRFGDPPVSPVDQTSGGQMDSLPFRCARRGAFYLDVSGHLIKYNNGERQMPFFYKICIPGNEKMEKSGNS